MPIEVVEKIGTVTRVSEYGVQLNGDDQWLNPDKSDPNKLQALSASNMTTGDTVTLMCNQAANGRLYYTDISFDGQANGAVTPAATPAITVLPGKYDQQKPGIPQQTGINRSVSLKAAVDVIGPFSMPTSEDHWSTDDATREKYDAKYIEHHKNFVRKLVINTAEGFEAWLDRPVQQDVENKDDVEIF